MHTYSQYIAKSSSELRSMKMNEKYPKTFCGMRLYFVQLESWSIQD